MPTGNNDDDDTTTGNKLLSSLESSAKKTVALPLWVPVAALVIGFILGAWLL